MDDSRSNTLRVLGMIASAAFVILLSGVLFLFAMCASGLSNLGGHPQPSEVALDFGLYLLAFAVLIGGIVWIVYLARGIVRDYRAAHPAPPSPSLAEQVKGLLPPQPQPKSVDLATHLSPASVSTLQKLSLVITIKIAAEVALGVVGWYGALGLSRAPFPLYRIGFMTWGLAAIAPHIVLLYALFRRPGRTAFAYALIIPSLHILFGLFGHSAFLAFVLRTGEVAAPLLSIIPWLLDILILYLAWRLIRLTGLLPDSARLGMAGVVIFLYTSLLPAVTVLLNRLA